MARYQGPCNRCKTPIDRKVRPGKEPLCYECAVRKMMEQQISYHDGTAEGVAFCRIVGSDAGDQIRARSGPAYERWRAGMMRAAGGGTTTEGETSDTFPA